MTNGIVSQPIFHRRLSARTTPLKIVKPDDDETYHRDGMPSDSEPSPKATPESVAKPPLISSHTRQVSHEGLANCLDTESERKQPASDVTETGASVGQGSGAEFEKATATVSREPAIDATSIKCIPPQPNPLHTRSILLQHTKSLRLEAHLHPMRLILSRLMTNISYNRKGVFNTPVDPVALGLIDYFTVIKNPMDLGTIKNRLHSVAYKSRLAVADHIRLCFRNAMIYNPPQNAIHLAAKELLKYFEDQLSSFCPELADFELLESGKELQSQLEFIGQSHDGDVVGLNSLLSSGRDQHLHSDAMGEMPVAALAHHFTTRNSSSDVLSVSINCKKRKKRGSKVNPGHSCQWCNGNVCIICEQGCLPLQPTLLVCSGSQCIGAKIRKGATYFTAPDGSCQFCQRCYVGLAAVLPGKHEDSDHCRYKRNLLKRKNDEESVEHWLSCSNCESSMHHMCVMHNPFVHSTEDVLCPNCYIEGDESARSGAPRTPLHNSEIERKRNVYTFVVGEDHPRPMKDITSSTGRWSDCICADSLPENSISRFIEDKVRQRMLSADSPNSEKTVIVRMISDCERYFKVPDVVRKHFRIVPSSGQGNEIIPPSKVLYRSKAVALFQKFDGLDVCIFIMYVQEYDGDDEFDTEQDKYDAEQEKRVYIAYLDSVEHFRPREFRTAVYQEVLSAYLATARLRGYESAHIWACPPSRGNSFVFWNHPAAQRTPNVERLTNWYYAAISRAIDCGVVSNVQSLFESDFEDPCRQVEESATNLNDSAVTMSCPPLLEGDFWIEEALRIHSGTFSRLLKENSGPLSEAALVTDEINSICPVMQFAAMFREKVIMHPLSKAFRRPVNAAAMKLNDYHTIISKPMDLGTVLSRCILGEYETLKDVVDDMNLVFANAKKFNPPGHIIHTTAIELEELFITELTACTEAWVDPESRSTKQHYWEDCSTMSMSLNKMLKNGKVELIGGDQIFSLNLGSVKAEQPKFVSRSSCRQFNESSNISGVCDGPEAVRHRMVGNDVWLLEKKVVLPPKYIGLPKSTKRGRKSTVELVDEPVFKRRRRAWLHDEVGVAVRRMRTSFFKCSLLQYTDDFATAEQSFRDYSSDYKESVDVSLPSSRIADARHAFLEVSQFRGLEFDTLRRAKYSSAILLYHLHHDDAPGLIPECTSCGKRTEGVRWHRVGKVMETRPAVVSLHTGRKPKSTLPFRREELCQSCFSGHQNQSQFIPLQVSL